MSTPTQRLSCWLAAAALCAAAAPAAEATVLVPAGLRRVELAAISTGHCTDGTDADEFITKDNVTIDIDATVAAARAALQS